MGESGVGAGVRVWGAIPPALIIIDTLPITDKADKSSIYQTYGSSIKVLLKCIG